MSLALWGRANCVSAQGAPTPLYLEVSLNGHSTSKIAEFTQHPDGRFSAKRSELKELTVNPGSGKPDDQVFLDTIDSLKFTYDESNQKIALRLKASALQHNSYDATGRKERSTASVTTGAVLNYGLYGSFTEHSFTADELYEGMSASLEARFFGDYGTLETSAIIGLADFDSQRLDTSWTYSFAESLITVRAGDFVSGGFGWTRPVRMAGFKIERNFALRPDLITKPLPNISGSAAVPSTVDVYVNNIKTYTKDVPSGPFTIRQLPVVSGKGTTRVVVRDATGRETITEAPFYSSSVMLRPGIVDFSAEAGLARFNYGSESNDYDDRPMASGSVRYGVSDELTIAWHGEAGLGVINSGAGVLTQVGMFGTLELGASVSRHGGAVGEQVFAAFQGDFKWISLNARTQRTFNGYTDLAAHAQEPVDVVSSIAAPSNLGPPKAIDFVSVGVPIDWTGGQLNLSYIHTVRGQGEVYDAATVSYSQNLTKAISMHATAFKSFSDGNGVGAYVGVNMSLGNRRSVSTSVTRDDDGVGAAVTYAKSADRKPGGFGWRVYANANTDDNAQAVRRADFDYNASKVILRGSIAHGESGVSGSYFVEGAVAMTGDEVFLARRIDDSFAVVDAGAPGVEVHVENRVVGRTGSDGKLLVPGLHAYQKNKITIDPSSLPVNAHIPSTKIDAVPVGRSGMAVRFNVESTPKAALVEFRKPDGAFIEAGYTVKLVHSGKEFLIGYDGRSYIEGLAAINTAEIELSDRTCRATFPFASDSNVQVLISGVVCK